MSDRAVSMAKVSKRLTRSADLKDDALLMMEPYNNREEKIMPAPYAISILGQLIVISSMSNFRLATAQDGFNYINWSYFRESLRQVSTEGYRIFQMARDEMACIKFETDIASEYMKDVVGVLLRGSDLDVKNALPVVFENMANRLMACRKCSERVLNKFNYVLNIIHELEHSYSLTKLIENDESYRERFKSLAHDISQLKQKQEQLKKHESGIKEQYYKVNAKLDKYTKQYNKAIKEIPSAGDLLLYNFVDACANVIAGVASVLTFSKAPKAIGCFKKIEQRDTVDTSKLQKKGVIICAEAVGMDPQSFTALNRDLLQNDPPELTFEDHALYIIGARLLKPVENLSLFFSNRNKLQRFLTNHLENILHVQIFCLESILDDAVSQHSSSSLRQDICNVCRKAIECYKDIKKGKTVDTSKLIKKVSTVCAEAMRIDTQCSTALNRDLLRSDPPLKNSNKSNNRMSTAQQAIKNSHFKKYAASQRLVELRKKFAASEESALKNGEKLTKALSKVAEFHAAEAATKVLRKGKIVLEKLQEQWWQLSQFFDQIANLIQINLSRNINTFIQCTSNASEAHFTGYTVSQGMRDIIYKTTFEATKYFHLVNHLSSEYFQVFDEYLMDSVHSLGNLLAIENPKEIQAAQLALINNCKNTVQEIKMLTKRHGKEFKQKTSDRMNAIELEYDAVLPPISKEDQDEILNIIKQGISQAPERAVWKGIELEIDV